MLAWSWYSFSVSLVFLGVAALAFAGGALCAGKESPALGGTIMEPGHVMVSSLRR